MTLRRSGFALALLVGALTLLPASAGPVATPIAEPCVTPARAWDEITIMIATPAPPEPERTGALPWGEQIGAEDQAAIRSTIEQFIACSNAGEPLRVYGLYTDAYLQRLLSRERPAIDHDRYNALATPMPAEASAGAELIEISGARRIVMSGQLGALITLAYPSVPEPKTFFFTFQWIDDSLQIDDILGEITFSLP